MKSYDNKREILLGQVKFNPQNILFVGQKRDFMKKTCISTQMTHINRIPIPHQQFLLAVGNHFE